MGGRACALGRHRPTSWAAKLLLAAILAGDFAPDIFDDVAEVSSGGFFEPHAALVKTLVDFDGGFLHHAVALLRATAKEEIIALGDARVAIFGIEGQTQYAGFTLRIDGSHKLMLAPAGSPVASKCEVGFYLRVLKSRLRASLAASWLFLGTTLGTAASF